MIVVVYHFSQHDDLYSNSRHSRFLVLAHPIAHQFKGFYSLTRRCIHDKCIALQTASRLLYNESFQTLKFFDIIPWWLGDLET
jgi:hypothetical protein